MPNCFWRRQALTYHPVIGWWHLPSLRARLQLGGTFHTVITNSVGMRSTREYPHSQPTARKRVIFLGDSYTAGDGVSNGQRFTDLLESRFPHLDALNFGLNGSGTDQQLLIYETMASRFEADAYVICVCVENIARNLYTCFPSFDYREHQVIYRAKPYFEMTQDGSLAVRNQPVPNEKRGADALGDWQCSFPHLPGSTDPYAIYSYPERPHWQMMKAILQRFLSRVRGKPVLVIPMPMYDHYLGQNPPTYWPRFQEIGNQQERVHTIDLLPAFKCRPLRDRASYRFPDDPHYTVTAHAVVADAIEAALRAFCAEVLATDNCA